jgi:Concanavalin A-like lectin/glucanases superfamily
MKSALFIAATLCFVISLSSVVSCSKNSNPQPIHDTVTVIKNDTTTDTLYATKPDPTVNLTKGLLLYLNFTGNIADSSGNNNQTTAVGNVLTYDTHGYANNAFGADGGGEAIYVTNNGSIKFDTAWSLSFDFMVNDVRTETYISMVDPVTGYAPSFIAGTTLPGVPYIDLGTGDVSTGCNSYGTNNNINVADTTNFIPVPGSWYNFVGIYYEGSVKTYINGVLVGTKVGQGTAANLCPNSQVIIGAWWNSQPLNMNGKMDNVRLYDRQLTPHEIVALSSNYQVTSTKITPGLRTAR